jgi:uncharacterized RDD family membrane protein YckC
MSQPPDDRRRMPWEPEPSDAAEQPTVQWTPPPPAEPAPQPAPDPAPAPAPEPPAGTTSPEPPVDGGDVQEGAPEPPADPVAPPAGPLLSSTPSAPPPVAGWQSDAQAPPPVVGWQTPASSAEPAPIEGYVIAGPWARLVAWLIDSLLVTLVPTLLSFIVIDWQPLVDAMIEQIEDPSTVAPLTFVPTTVEAFIVTLIGVGISYLYFVGFWTGPWMATPGMRLLGLRVGDEQRGAILSITAATKRWLAMGAWLALLAFVGPFGTIAGLGTTVLQIALFFSVIVHPRRQGLHDRVASSLVVRKRAVGDSVVMGCVVLVALFVLFAVVIGVVSLAVLLPLMEPLFDDLVVPA